MAIQSVYEALNHGFTASSAYTKLASFVVENIDPKKISLYTETYYDSAARLEGKTPISYNSFQMPWVEDFTFADIYNFIKLQPEFIGATDVI